MSDRAQRILTAFLPAVAAGAVLWPVIRIWFFADDFYWITLGREALQSPSQILSHRFFNYYRPVINGLFAVETLWGGLSAVPRHVLNLLIHLGSVVLLTGWLRRLHVRPFPAMAAAFLFAVGPVHLDAVAWVSGRTDLAAMLLMLSSLAVMPRFAAGGKLRTFVSVAALAGAVLSKETAVLTPVVLCVTDRIETGHRIAAARWVRARWPWLLIAVTALILHTGIQFTGEVTFRELQRDITVSGWLMNTVSGVTLSILQFLPFLKPYSAMDILGLSALVMVLILWRCRGGTSAETPLSAALIPAGLILATVLMIPSAAVPFPLLPEPHLTFGRFIYIPALGTVLLLAGLFSGCNRRTEKHSASRFLTITAFLLLAVSGVHGTLNAIRHWESITEVRHEGIEKLNQAVTQIPASRDVMVVVPDSQVWLEMIPLFVNRSVTVVRNPEGLPVADTEVFVFDRGEVQRVRIAAPSKESVN